MRALTTPRGLKPGLTAMALAKLWISRPAPVRSMSANETCTTTSNVLNVRTGKKEKIARLFQLHANKRERLDKAIAANPGNVRLLEGKTLPGVAALEARVRRAFDPAGVFETGRFPAQERAYAD